MSSGRFNSHGVDLPPQLPFPIGETDELVQGPAGNWRDCFPEIIGRSPAMTSVLQIISKVARTDSAVLIYGESGTGKELIASALHRLSPRSSRRIVPINCSAIPEALLESELFGYEKGAFTGAANRKPGLFEIANGGTILLDEIGDMPQRLQAKLLRVLQEKQYSPVGSSELKRADVRIVAATNVNLQQAVTEGRFRLDLFYRLNVVPIDMPPLRQRAGDVDLLLEYFLELAHRKHAVSTPCYFLPETVAQLLAYPWPGNVRELQNLVERLVIMSGGGAIGLHHLPREYLVATGKAEPAQADVAMDMPPSVARVEHAPESLPPMAGRTAETIHYPQTFGLLPEAGLDLCTFMEKLENSLIMQALERTANNKNQAAKLLGLNRTTLVERIKKRRLAPINMPSKEL